MIYKLNWFLINMQNILNTSLLYGSGNWIINGIKQITLNCTYVRSKNDFILLLRTDPNFKKVYELFISEIAHNILYMKDILNA